MYALFNFDQTSSLHALIRACTLILFSVKYLGLNLQKLSLIQDCTLIYFLSKIHPARIFGSLEKRAQVYFRTDIILSFFSTT